MNNLDKQYTDLLQDILENGTRKMDRTGTGTISVFGRQIRHKMSEGFPVLTTKKMAWKTMVTELIWFLRGDTNIKFLVDNGFHIWDGDAYKNYENKYYKGEAFGYKKLNNLEYSPDLKLSQEEFINKIKTDTEFAKKWGELGPIYGKQWRSWKKNDSFIVEDDVWKNNEGWCSLKDFNKDELYIDQIANSINLLKTDPDSRRNRVNAWNVGELDQMVLPPCHTDFQFFTRVLSLQERLEMIQPFGMDALIPEAREKWMEENNIPKRAISLMWNQRSVDTFLGLPFNIASYGLLLEIIAKEVNMVPDELIGNLGDTHLYLNHIEQAKEQIGRERTHEEMVEMYYAIENKKDREEYWTWETRFEDNNISKHTRNPYPLPKLILDDWYSTQGDPSNTPKDISEFLKNIHVSHIRIENYQSHPSIKAPLSN
jgi:thymidylate synthase